MQPAGYAPIVAPYIRLQCMYVVHKFQLALGHGAEPEVKDLRRPPAAENNQSRSPISHENSCLTVQVQPSRKIHLVVSRAASHRLNRSMSWGESVKLDCLFRGVMEEYLVCPGLARAVGFEKTWHYFLDCPWLCNQWEWGVHSVKSN